MNRIFIVIYINRSVTAEQDSALTANLEERRSTFQLLLGDFGANNQGLLSCTFSSLRTWMSSGAMSRMVWSMRAFIFATGIVKTSSQERMHAREWTTATTG